MALFLYVWKTASPAEVLKIVSIHSRSFAAAAANSIPFRAFSDNMSLLSSAINDVSTTDEKEDGLHTIKIKKKFMQTWQLLITKPLSQLHETLKTPLTSVLKRYWSQRHMFTTHNPPFYCEEGLQFQMPASENLYSGLSNLIDFQMSIKWLSSQSKIPYTVYNLRNKQRVWPVPAELEGFNVW